MFHVSFAALAIIVIATSSIATDAVGGENRILWVDCASNVPQALQGTALPSKLPSALHCGRLEVPMDYKKPISANNTISLGFSMYRPDKPLGLVNFNPGGPADEVSSFAWQIALNLSQAFSFAGLEKFDFLAMDVRGTHTSNPLNCSIGDFSISLSLPANETQFETYQAAISTYAQSCIKLSTPKGIVAHIGTADTVQDWDSLRDALGYQQFHFLAWSYGAYGAALYANKYPRNVGRFVFDAIIPRGVSDLELNTYEIRAVNRLLLRADAYCIYDSSCPFHPQGKGSVVKAFTTVLGRALAGTSVNTSADDVRTMVIFAYLSGNPNFSALNVALYDALNGNWTGLSSAEFGPLFTQELAEVLPIACLDKHIDNNTFPGFDNIRKSIAKDDPADMEYSQDLYLMALCSSWPYHGNSNIPLPLNSPVLLVTSDFDLNAPTEFSTFEQNQAPQSTLIVRHGDDHGTFFVTGPARTAEFDFLATGQFPKPINDTLVTIYSPGSQRGPMTDPYVAPIGPSAGDMGS